MLQKHVSRLAAGLFVLVIGISALNPTVTHASTTFSYGDGSEEKPYKISDCDQLQAITSDLSAHYELVSNIDCDANDFGHIGSDLTPFTGTLEGNNKIIKDLHIDDHGLFDTIENGTVQNILLKNPSVSGSTRVGSLAGSVKGASVSISNIHVVNGSVSGTSDYVGGLVGGIGVDNPVLQKSSFKGSVSSPGVMGGFIGSASNAAYVRDNYVQASLTILSGGGSTVGGFVGLAGSTQMSNNYAVVTVDATDADGYSSVGGFGGLGTGWIQTSFADMALTGTPDEIGDFLGFAGGLTVNANYYASHGHSWASNTNAGGGVTAVDTGANPNWFKDSTNTPFTFGWDFENTWEEVESDYPRLRDEAAFSEASNDVNGDSINDSYQAKVIEVPDENTYLTGVELASDSNCTLDPAGYWLKSGEILSDPNFELQVPTMTGFRVYCPTNGAQVQVTLIYPELFDTSDSVLRYFNDVSNQYSTVTGATFGTRTVNSTLVTTVTYIITDGGALDTDGTANGIIDDPVGLAVDNTPVTVTNSGSSSGSSQSSNSSGNLGQTGTSIERQSKAALISLLFSLSAIAAILLRKKHTHFSRRR